MPDPIEQPETHRCARAHRCSQRETIEVKAGQQCTCQCHGMPGPYAVCDVEGGCGHLHAELKQPETKIVGATIADAYGLCESCRAIVAEAVADLPTSYVELDALLSSGSSGITSDIITQTRELPVPIRLSVEALQRSIVHETSAWAQRLCRRMGVEWAPERMAYCRAGFVLQRAVGIIEPNLDTLLALGPHIYRHHRTGEWIERDGLAGALELLHLHGMVRFAAGKTKLIHRLPAPCPRCERMTLVRHNGSELVECEGEGCPGKWPESDYRRLCLVLAEDYREDAA